MTDVLMTLDENGGNIVLAGRQGDRGLYQGGAERVTNGDFDSDLSDWTDNCTGEGRYVEWAAPGQARLYSQDPGPGYCRLDQQIAETVVARYRLSYTVVTLNVGSKVRLGTTEGGYDLLDIEDPAVGGHVVEFEATGSVTWVSLYYLGGTEFEVTDVSIVCITDAHFSGEVVMTDGPETDIKHALFGGRTDPEWWGDLVGDVSYKSETQMILETLPMTSANIIRVETAVRKDLAAAGMTDIGEVSVSIPQPNRVSITVGDIEIERDWT